MSEYFDVELVRDLAEMADADTDVVSIEYLVAGEEDDGDEPGGHRHPTGSEIVEGALVFIKGDVAVREFRAWATSRGLLTSDKPWRSDKD